MLQLWDLYLGKAGCLWGYLLTVKIELVVLGLQVGYLKRDFSRYLAEPADRVGWRYLGWCFGLDRLP